MNRPLLATVVLLACIRVSGQTLLPWQRWVETPAENTARDLPNVLELPWASTGGPEGTLSVSEGAGPWGGRYFNFRVKIDWHNAGAYPQGWPAFETQPEPPLDFSGYDAIRYWIRCETDIARQPILRFILWSAGQGRIQEIIPGIKRGEWVQVMHRISSVPNLDRVDRLHFFLCESDYAHGEEVTFHIGGFQLVNMQREVSKLPGGEGAMGLWVGERAETSERIVMLDQGTERLPALLVIEAGEGLDLKADDDLRVKLHEVFSGKETWREAKLGRAVAAGTVRRIRTELDISGLEPGYYLVVADVQRDGKSLLGGRVGSDDLYVRKPEESMTYSVLSIRTGMVLWLRDLLFGDIMGWARASLPHVYDPLCKETYGDFLRVFATSTGKHTEGNEAGDSGLALAAEAFRKSGDMVRCRFTEWLMEDSFEHMITKMQAPNGGCITWTNELADAGIVPGSGSQSFGAYDSNQIGEWMRALTYGIIYYSQIPEKWEYARRLSAACRKAGDYLIAHALQESDGVPRVMRHLTLVEQPDGTVKQITYYQEGRQCDVYLGRALAGLSYYAYAMQLLGEQVPQDWWEVMDNTVRWCERKMKPNGWFDWQCEDVVEGGCHTFLGNIYIGEGIFGVYLASRRAGRDVSAQVAAEVARRAYRYVTDDCMIRGSRFNIGGAAEFWVGPYMYWLFTEYLDTVGPEERLADWLRRLDEQWSVERQWKDFLDRPTDGTGYVYRAAENGMLNVAILGYLGIKQMAEVGQPLHWPLP